MQQAVLDTVHLPRLREHLTCVLLQVAVSPRHVGAKVQQTLVAARSSDRFPDEPLKQVCKQVTPLRLGDIGSRNKLGQRSYVQVLSGTSVAVTTCA